MRILVSVSRSVVAFAVVCSVLAGTHPNLANAEDSWNPFIERNTLRNPEPRRSADTAPPNNTLEPFGRGDRPWRAPDGPSPERDGDPTAGPRGYIAPPRQGEPIFRDNDVAVQRRDLAPLAPQTQQDETAEPGTGSSAPGRSNGADDTATAPGHSIANGTGPADWPALDDAKYRDYVRLLPEIIPSQTLVRLFLEVIRSTPEASGANLIPGLKRDVLYTRGLFLRPDAQLPAPDTDDALVRTVSARSRIISGETQAACVDVRSLLADRKSLPNEVFAEVLVLGGLCAIETGNASGATLAGQLAREAGYRGPITLDLLEAHGTSADTPIRTGTLAGIDAALLKRDNRRVTGKQLETATPAALAVFATAESIPVPLRIAAAERAAALHIITPETLAAAYAAASGLRVGDPVTPSTRRARLFLAIRDNAAFLQRARNIRSFLDQSRDDGLYRPALEAIATFAKDLPKIPEIGWFAETGIEVALAQGDTDEALVWVGFGEQLDIRPSDGFAAWRALAAVIAQPGTVSGTPLDALEAMAIQRRFQDAELHRLATVLDALNFHVPIGLWNAASSTPQPKGGHLPPTGVLRQLADASKAKAIGPTVMLTIATLGVDGPSKANILALGDSIRALVRIGRVREARALAFEALFDNWPRSRIN